MFNTTRLIGACAVSCLLSSVSPALAQQFPSPSTTQLEIETETGARCKVFAGGPTIGVTAGNQPVAYFNTNQDNPKDMYGMLSLSVPIGGGASRSREICFQMGELELKKKKLDIYFELFERGVITQDEIDTLRQNLFPTPSNSKPNSVKVRPQATIRYEDGQKISAKRH